MNTRILRWASGMAVVLAAACSSPGGREGDSGGEAFSLTGVELAVATAQAIQAMPGATDSIFAAHGLTPAGFDSLMYDIAADPEKARTYAEAIR